MKNELKTKEDARGAMSRCQKLIIKIESIVEKMNAVQVETSDMKEALHEQHTHSDFD